MFREYHSKEEFVDDLKTSWNKRVRNFRVGGIIVGILMLILGIIACIYKIASEKAHGFSRGMKASSTG